MRAPREAVWRHRRRSRRRRRRRQEFREQRDDFTDWEYVLILLRESPPVVDNIVDDTFFQHSPVFSINAAAALAIASRDVRGGLRIFRKSTIATIVSCLTEFAAVTPPPEEND